ncbi:YkgJ family cysteine cluster protein [Castellaniella sp.]|uniref:YkgJ family cysteine cluster protein n=1 Tax=Castellaniella sp. TaxID=1955812 RepID=UPI002AFF0E6A|nr:YkgJ family cysteine cluster protein [Castellaniella sp.]
MPETQTPFPCSQCGKCCEHVGSLAATADMDRGDGVCMFYDQTNRLCLIYDHRPDICRVDKQYTMHYQDMMSWEDFVALNARACKKLQDLDTS